MRHLLAMLTLLLAAFATPAAIAQDAAPAGIPVTEGGLVATWFPPASGKPGSTILVLGGSEGGTQVNRAVGAAFAREGFGVLALAYFKADGLPQQLQEIPLEYFTRAIDWLAANPMVDPQRIGIWGGSKGGEAALLIASRDQRIHAVVAAVPSSVMWQGINFEDYNDAKASWSADGKPLAYLPYDQSAPFTSIVDLYQRSLKALAAHPDTVIPVERINGPVLLLSGKQDMMWPATQMSEQVIARLRAHDFPHAYRHIAYDDAGHGAVFPVVAGDTKMLDSMGGTPAGNAAARADMWPRVIAFLRDSLGG